MKALKIKVWNMADHIITPEDVYLSLKIALEDDDPEHFFDVLGVVVRSKGYAELKRRAQKRGQTKLKTAAAAKSGATKTTIKRARKIAA